MAAEQRCKHGFLRSKVSCRACNRVEELLAGFRGEPTPLPPLHRAIRHLPPARTEWIVDPQAVIEATAVAWRIPVRRLINHDRERHVADARIACFWLLRKLTMLSWPQMGLRVGNRDHSTAMAGFRSAERLRAKHEDFRERTDRILKAIEEKKGAAA